MVHQVAGEIAGQGIVVQVNTQENPLLAGRFGIRSIPAVLVLKGGKAVGSVNGALDRNGLLSFWKRHVP